MSGRGTNSLALAACCALRNAYSTGAENGGSVDWSDVDRAHELAVAAIDKSEASPELSLDAVGTLETLVESLDEGASPAELLTYINMQARAVVGPLYDEQNPGPKATVEQRAACHAEGLLGIARSIVADREAAGIDENDADDPLAAIVRRARSILHQIDNPS